MTTPPNPLDLTGQRILVTGASSGIGRETAVLLSKLGAHVAVAGRNAERTEATFHLLEGTGHCRQLWDFGSREDPKLLVQNCAAELTGLTGLVHCAGISLNRPLRFQDATEFRDLMEINANSSLLLAKAFRPRSICPDGGSIVFLSSTAALTGERSMAAYSASKGAIIALTRALAVELTTEKIRVNCIAPGLTKTEMFEAMKTSMTEEQIRVLESNHPLGLGEPIDVAYPIAFLLSKAARWITGTTMVVDGGYTCA